MKLEELRNKRLDVGLSQQKLASKIGISRPQLSLIENGKRNPSLEVLKKIAQELGEPIEIN